MPNPHAPLTSSTEDDTARDLPQRTRLPREDGTDIGISSPVALSDEAVGIISKLRNLKDQDEDYSRWKDVIFRAKNAEALDPGSMANRAKGLDARASRRAKEIEDENSNAEDLLRESGPIRIKTDGAASSILSATSDRLEPITSAPPISSVDPHETDGRYCPECYLPLQPDPQPEKLFIFLHAWRYTTKEWSFKTDMPFWAAKGYRWQDEIVP